MADVEENLPGTWVVRPTLGNAPLGKAIVTFTSDRGLVERFSGVTEGNVGAWEQADEQADEEDRFRFMAYRYVVGPPFENRRVRATCRLTGNNTFSCTCTLDVLDIDDNVMPGTTAAGISLNGTRLNVVPE